MLSYNNDGALYSLTFEDGRIIDGFKISGNTYCREEPIDESIFKNNSKTIIVKSSDKNEPDQELHNVVFDYQEETTDGENKIWFVFFHEITITEAQEALSKLEYLAMLLDVEL